MTETTAADAAVALVAMTREEPQFPGGPTTAEVHPEEVANYAAGGWRLADGAEADLPPADKALEDQSIEELRATARAEGVSFAPRTGAAKLIADISAAREAAAKAAAEAAAAAGEGSDAGADDQGEGEGGDD